VKLISAGYNCGPTGADGDFGANTEKAVKAFQSEHNGPNGESLKADGIIGPATWWALTAAPQRITYTVTIRNLTAEQKDKLMKEYPGAESRPED
jgi:peptidoglycan hydrolase-like protein with peptidoglycan-binding domain